MFRLRPRIAGRLAWSAWAVAMVLLTVSVVLIATAPGSLTGLLNGNSFDPHILLIPGFMTVGAAIVSRRSTNRIGWLFLALGLVSAVETTSFLYSLHAVSVRPFRFGAAFAGWLSNWEWSASFGLLFFLLLLFPNGRLPSRRWRPVAWAMAFFAGVFVIYGMFQDEPLQIGDVRVSNPVGLIPQGGVVGAAFGIVLVAGTALGAASLIASALAPAIRLRQARGDEREQLRWLAWVMVITLGGAIIAILSETVAHIGVLGVSFGVASVFGLAFGMPVAVGIAVLKYRLYDIDTVIRRSAVIGLLAAFITAVYLAIVVGGGALVGSSRNPTLSIIATALIAVAFQPIRDRARRLADRLVFGKRAAPYEVLSEFSERMAATYSIEDILPRMVGILAEGTGAEAAEVWLRVDDELHRAASSARHPEPVAPLRLIGGILPEFEGAARAAAVTHQGELLGALVVRRRADDPLTSTEESLLSDLASQAAPVIRNVGLVEDLRASRQRIVAAQDERAKALERNLHDGAQQQIVALTVKLRLLGQLVDRDAEQAKSMAAQLQHDATDALEELRDLARGIYPQLLADQGLVAALGSQARKSVVPVSIEADGVGRYPRETEAAVYFSCLEALQNVAKYANASNVTLRLSDGDQRLTFEVTDDGIGFDASQTSFGTGLQGITDRLSAVGGDVEIRSTPGAGTSVTGHLPVADEARES